MLVRLVVAEGVGVLVAEMGECVGEGVAVGEHDAAARGVLAPRSGVTKSERYSVFAGAVRASEAVRLLLGLAFSAMLKSAELVELATVAHAPPAVPSTSTPVTALPVGPTASQAVVLASKGHWYCALQCTRTRLAPPPRQPDSSPNQSVATAQDGAGAPAPGTAQSKAAMVTPPAPLAPHAAGQPEVAHWKSKARMPSPAGEWASHRGVRTP